MHREVFGLLAGHLADPQRRQRQVFHHRQVGKQVELLEHHADFRADGRDVAHIIGQFDPVDHDIAAFMDFETVDTADHGRLAGSRRAANHDLFAGPHRQVDILQGLKNAVELVDAAQFDHGRRFRAGLPRLFLRRILCRFLCHSAASSACTNPWQASFRRASRSRAGSAAVAISVSYISRPNARRASRSSGRSGTR